MRLPLRYGPLPPERWNWGHSSLRWTVPSGCKCAAGTVLAYCNLALPWRADPGLALLAPEARDLQLAFVLQVPGRVSYAQEAGGGGQMDYLAGRHSWRPAVEFGQIEVAAAPSGPLLRLLMVAGRRVSELAEARDGLLTGWHSRKRAWWPDADQPGPVLVGLGSCEMTAIMQGSRPGMLDLLDGAAGGAQLLVAPDTALVPCARTTLEQLRRTEAEKQAIAADMASGLLAIGKLEPADWLVAGAVQDALLASPLSDPCPVLLRSGPRRPDGPAAVIMSLHGEPMRVFRHRRLDYTLAFYDFRLMEMGRGFQQWLGDSFEPVFRAPQDICADFAALAAALRDQAAARTLLVANRFTSATRDDLPGYAGLDEPLGRSIGTVHAKEMNLALAELAAGEPFLRILDIDAMTTELGAMLALPDGMHVAGELQSLAHQEIWRQLALAGVRGFSPARSASDRSL